MTTELIKVHPMNNNAWNDTCEAIEALRKIQLTSENPFSIFIAIRTTGGHHESIDQCRR